MSRTIRRLPVTGGRIKTYAITWHLDDKCQGMTLTHYTTGMTYLYRCPRRMEEAMRDILNRVVPRPIIEVGSKQFRVVSASFFVQQTEEDVARNNARSIMEWCRKNGTCKRQRKNAVRLLKHINAHRTRRALKTDTRKQVMENELPSAGVGSWQDHGSPTADGWEPGCP